VTTEREEVGDLVLAARRGDRAASERLYRRFAPMALRTARACCGGRSDDAEDLVQETFVTCLSRLEDLREPRHFGAWMLRSLKNRAINATSARRTRERTTEGLAAEPTESEGTTPLELLLGAERRALLKETFDSFEEGPLKEAARVHYIEGVEDLGEVAERLGVPRSTVTTRLDRFRRALRKRIASAILRSRSPQGRAPTIEVVK